MYLSPASTQVRFHNIPAYKRVPVPNVVRVRLTIIRNARIKNVVKYQSCMAYKLLIIFKRTRRRQLVQGEGDRDRLGAQEPGEGCRAVRLQVARTGAFPYNPVMRAYKM